MIEITARLSGVLANRYAIERELGSGGAERYAQEIKTTATSSPKTSYSTTAGRQWPILTSRWQ